MRRFPTWLALVVISAGTASLGSANPVAAQAVQPNILVIVTDDQRAGTLGLMPAVRRWLVRGGTRYPNAFATTPLCCPSRGSILTGLLAHNHGLLLNKNEEDAMIAAESLMVQHALRSGAYLTGLFGKYLNFWPNDRNPSGWDRWAVTPRVRYSGAEWNVDGVVHVIQRNSTPFVASRALNFLEEADALNDQQPWFAHVGFHAPHLPARVPAAYTDEPVPTWQRTPAQRERDFSDKPAWLRRSQRPSLDVLANIRTRQLRSLVPLDDQIDRIMFRLEDLGELDDTLVIYASDNGFMWGDHGLAAKSAPYDASIRVPLLVRWPGRVPAGAADTRLVGLLDVTPTILTAAGVPFPHEMDGADLLGGVARRRLPLEFWDVDSGVPSWRAVLTRRWIYVEYLDDAGRRTGRECYDRARDPHQLANVLRDGIRGNEPNLARLAELVLRLSSCSGADCLD